MTDQPPPTQSQYALDVSQLSAGYPGNNRAIDDLNFVIHKGERVALIGPNGAGKTTLFKAIAGLIPFTDGEISVYGEDCRSSHNFVGYVPQNSEIDWDFPVNVTDVVMMGRARQSRWLPWAKAVDRDRVHTLLAQLNLSSLAKRQIGELSGGQKRRVFIARALAQEANILLMDEPFNGVDGAAEDTIMETLNFLTDQGITLLLATHDMARAARDFDRIMLLKRRLIAYGAPDDVMNPAALQQAYGGAMRIFNDGQATIFIADEHGTGH